MSRLSENPYLFGPVVPLFFKTSLPIIIVMLLNGLFTVVDAIFVGKFVGPQALTGVTLMFPLFMLIIAANQLVGTGMASILARHLGAERLAEAAQVMASALLLSLALSLVFMLGYYLFGDMVIDGLANGDAALAELGQTYMSPLIYGIFLTFCLTVNSDAFRSEGQVGLMAVLAVGGTMLNIAFNYTLIVVYDMGVLGSALGTLAAQAISLVAVIVIRMMQKGRLRLFASQTVWGIRDWPGIAVLGLPPALNFAGVSLMAMTVIFNVQIHLAPERYADVVAAYGILTRITAFTFLPLFGFNLAAQSLVGNNAGAGLMDRVSLVYKSAIVTALIYCGLVEVLLISNASSAAALFVDDPQMIKEFVGFVPIVVSGFVLFGPVLISAGYFQAMGDAKRAAILGLSRIYVFALPTTLLLPWWLGEWGIWIAAPIADIAMLGILVLVLGSRYRDNMSGLALNRPM